ncbi:MAG: domain 2 [Verrucomicrobiota bacterium]|jgi:hypothetical protein
MIHVCGSDGQRVGEFEEADFRDRIFRGQLQPDTHYWHEGMADWKPVSQYRALAKTQRISFAPPMRSTVKMDMDGSTEFKPEPATQSMVGRLLNRIRRVTGSTRKK